jgi:hypothetical protein
MIRKWNSVAASNRNHVKLYQQHWRDTRRPARAAATHVFVCSDDL